MAMQVEVEDICLGWLCPHHDTHVFRTLSSVLDMECVEIVFSCRLKPH